MTDEKLARVLDKDDVCELWVGDFLLHSTLEMSMKEKLEREASALNNWKDKVAEEAAKKRVEEAVKKAVEEERERCAKIAEKTEWAVYSCEAPDLIAEAIRSLPA